MQVDHHVFSLEIRIKVYLPDSQAAVHGCIDRLSLVIKASCFLVFFVFAKFGCVTSDARPLYYGYGLVPEAAKVFSGSADRCDHLWISHGGLTIALQLVWPFVHL